MLQNAGVRLLLQAHLMLSSCESCQLVFTDTRFSSKGQALADSCWPALQKRLSWAMMSCKQCRKEKRSIQHSQPQCDLSVM
jgi:hypothetical protein